MLILTIRSDNPQAEIGLYDGKTELAYITWQAHRQLAETIHYKIREVLQSGDKQLDQLAGLVVYQGPGSFTGLRIGLSVANALAASYNLPMSGQTGDDWQMLGIAQLLSGKGQAVILPEYGAPVHITQQKK